MRSLGNMALLIRVISGFSDGWIKGMFIFFSAPKTLVYIHFDHCFSFMSVYSLYFLYLLTFLLLL